LGHFRVKVAFEGLLLCFRLLLKTCGAGAELLWNGRDLTTK